jgi:predicted AAA+ superfamily ATPase
MKRNIIDFFINWKNKTNRKPLIIRGARQVGKTYTITDFGENHFDNFVKLDFEKTPRLIKIFNGDLDARNIIELIELETDTEIIIGKTLLFFDEIQLCPRALVALRYFYEDVPDLHVIAAGSLLEFEIEKVSFPVGRVEFKYMYPMTFDEFLINIGKEKLASNRPHLFDTGKISEFILSELYRQLKLYFIVGGMPEAVKTYNSSSLKAVSEVHENLFDSFIQDILKYEKTLELDILRNVLEAIPMNSSKNIKYVNLCPGATIYNIKKTLKVLEKCLIINTVHSSSAAGLPLSSCVNKSTLKICFLDIGFMQHICGIKAGEIINSEDLIKTYQGVLCEQFIGQELLVSGGSQNNKLFYWSRAGKNSNAEVDFLIVRDGKIFPLEIKNGPAGKLKSLHLFFEEHPNIKKGFVLNTGESGNVGKIFFRPLISKL